MTEAEWLKCADPLPMLGFLFGRPTDEFSEELAFARKKLLLDCACFSRLGPLVPLYGRLWRVHAERAAEGEYPKDLLAPKGEDADWELMGAIERAAGDEADRLRALLDLWTLCYNQDGTAPPFHPERAAQAAFVRDIYGNPFRPVNLDPSCAAPPVVTTASAIYESNAFDCMDRLIEALEDAGCTNKQIVDHCRGRSRTSGAAGSLIYFWASRDCEAAEVPGALMPSEPFDELIYVLTLARGLLLLPDNDFAWSSWENAEAAVRKVDSLINLLRRNQLPPRGEMSVLFAPTGPIQEVSLSSGWGDAFLKIAERFDRAAESAYGRAVAG